MNCPLCSVDSIYFPCFVLFYFDSQPRGYLDKMVHAVIVFFLVYLSYVNVYFKYVFAFF